MCISNVSINTISENWKGVSGRFTTSMLGGKAQVRYLFNINKIAHPDKNYDTLRGMFDIFSKYCNEKLVFKKTARWFNT